MNYFFVIIISLLSTCAYSCDDFVYFGPKDRSAIVYSVKKNSAEDKFLININIKNNGSYYSVCRGSDCDFVKEIECVTDGVRDDSIRGTFFEFIVYNKNMWVNIDDNFYDLHDDKKRVAKSIFFKSYDVVKFNGEQKKCLIVIYYDDYWSSVLRWEHVYIEGVGLVYKQLGVSCDGKRTDNGMFIRKLDEKSYDELNLDDFYDDMFKMLDKYQYDVTKYNLYNKRQGCCPE